MAKLSGQLFPESVWKAFGEHVGEEEEEKENEEKGGGEDACSEPLEAPLG